MAQAPRRDVGRPRGKPVEDAILRAALADLAAHGVGGISVDRVAAAANVNKTTIYRRYATTSDLVAAALHRAVESTTSSLPDHGDLSSDLRALLSQAVDLITSADGQALVRAGMSEEMSVAANAIPAGALAAPSELEQLVRRAIDRGEWDPGRPPEAMIGMLVGAVIHRVMLERQPADERWVTAIVGIFVRGVAPAAPADLDQQ